MMEPVIRCKVGSMSLPQIIKMSNVILLSKSMITNNGSNQALGIVALLLAKLRRLRMLITQAKPMVNVLWISWMGCLLSSCAVYSSGFSCPDGKGARCVMLSEVNRRIDSGEIETVYSEQCKNGKCGKQKAVNTPKKATPVHQIKIETQYIDDPDIEVLPMSQELLTNDQGI